MTALAQHYRVPTRLLDWTFKPLVAAYFAAIDCAQNPDDKRPVSLSSGGAHATLARGELPATQEVERWMMAVRVRPGHAADR